MTRAALTEALDENMAVHAAWVQRHLPGMHVRDELGYVLADSGLGTDTFNLVCRTRLSDQDAAERAAGAIAWFRCCSHQVHRLRRTSPAFTAKRSPRSR